ncbi:SDR family NAD(P)-dependent oxidoreductase [Solwaraspora sp. WMMD1047]|uniref:SDR family oxidoreductase n=1 Tax=Solwaraspora sp. WMMD1047 TaxID=3016102 RepID=UPI002417A10F|nr:SDR family oxidoreductase [Solwaraspora sp. WMMD1047]MDG4830653.1 SDR family NAD(P)-dependent oxidoreductase [Solwaraspora sp. WMMD1047]
MTTEPASRAGRSPASDHEPTRSALVTGASRGIGRGIALALAERGWRLTLVARDPARLAAAAAELSAAGAAQVETVAVDLAAPDAPAAAVAAHAAGHDGMDALVLAAGVGSAGSLHGYPTARYDKLFAINTRAPFVLVSQALPLLRAAARRRPSRGARVIALASIVGVYTEPSLAVYGATKAALLALCRGLNAEESAEGVTATAIAPGYVDTDMTAWVRDAVPPETMIPIDDVVTAVTALVDMSPRSVINEIVISRAGTRGYQA